jgi:hypothetical protein
MTTIVGAAFIAGIGIPRSAEATVFNFSFSGNGTSGNVLFDDTVLDSNPSPVNGEYLGAIVSFTININGTPQTETGIPTFEIIEGSSGSVIVGRTQCGSPVNCLAFLLDSNVFPPTDPSNFDLTFDYPRGSLSSDSLPVDVPATGPATLRSDLRQFSLGSEALSSIEPVSVPEPGIWSLFGIGAGLMGLFTCARGSRLNSQAAANAPVRPRSRNPRYIPRRRARPAGP